MGSSGTGNFSDYPGSAGGRPSGGQTSGGKGGGGRAGGGKPDDTDQCQRFLTDVSLEEVALAEYFKNHNTVPPPKTKVRTRKKLVGGRIGVETVSSSEVVGYLPTVWNYLRGCMQKGWEYGGQVDDSSASKLPKVKVSLTATR
jgi:hypothetical protein